MDQTKFQSMVQLALKNGVRIQNKFDVHKSEIKTWAKGTDWPKPLMQALIIRYIEEQLKKTKPE